MLLSHHTFKAITFAAIAFFPNAALADGNFYLKAFGGVSSLGADTLSLDGTASALDLDTGAIFGGAAGYDYANSPWSVEVEFAYRTADASPVASVGTGGDFASTALMLNGIYTFDSPGAFTPYVGLGLGVLTEVDFDVDAGAAAGEYNATGTFAVQAMLGASYAVSARVSLYGELRYLAAGSQTLDGPGGSTLEADYDSFDALFGLSLQF